MLNATPMILALSRPTYTTALTTTHIINIAEHVRTKGLWRQQPVYVRPRTLSYCQKDTWRPLHYTQRMKYRRSTCSLYNLTSVSEGYYTGCILSDEVFWRSICKEQVYLQHSPIICTRSPSLSRWAIICRWLGTNSEFVVNKSSEGMYTYTSILGPPIYESQAMLTQWYRSRVYTGCPTS
jgi:hypothetical protein